MGWFDKLLGRESKEPAGPEDLKKSWKKGWESHGDEPKQMATTLAYLEAVGRALEVENLKVVPRPEDRTVDLRGNLRGFPLKVTVRAYGSLENCVFKIGDTRHQYMDIEYDPEMADKPADVEDFEPDDKRIFVAPRVFFEGSDAEKEEAEFRKLPEELQERVTREMVRLGIRYFRSRSDEFYALMHGGNVNEIDDPVPWLVDTLKLALDVTLARGQVPPGKEATVAKQQQEEEPKQQKAWVRPLADSIARQLFGAKIVEKPGEQETEIRWVEGGVPVRITIDYAFDDFDIEARADGVTGDLMLEYDPDVTIEAKGDSNDPWDEIDHHVFFAKSVFVNGREAVARAQAAMLQSLGTTLLGEVVKLLEQSQGSMWLDDQVLYASMFDAHEVKDGGSQVIQAAKLIARVAKALPRGGSVPVGATAVRCTYCHGLWFPSPMLVTCSHCGARA